MPNAQRTCKMHNEHATTHNAQRTMHSAQPYKHAQRISIKNNHTKIEQGNDICCVWGWHNKIDKKN